MTMSTLYSNLGEILAELAPADLTDLRNIDLAGFGLSTSHTYRAQLHRLFGKVKLSAFEKTMVFALSMAVKNRDRILKAIIKFQNEAWFANVRKFYRDSTVQYTTDATPDKIPVVNIPGSNPSLCLNIHAIITPGNNADVMNKAIQTLWFGQLNLDEELQAENELWETEFWNNVVKKTRNKGRVASEVKKDKEGKEVKTEVLEFKFHKEFYANKKADKYPLLTLGGKPTKTKAITRTVLMTHIRKVKGLSENKEMFIKREIKWEEIQKVSDTELTREIESYPNPEIAALDQAIADASEEERGAREKARTDYINEKIAEFRASEKMMVDAKRDRLDKCMKEYWV